MNRLKGFHGQSKLKRAAINMIVKHMSEDNFKEVKKVFKIIDTDHSGTLDKNELNQALTKS